MKAKKLLVLGLLVSCVLTGCNKEGENLVAGDIETNTILIDKKGGVQTALVESFEKDYYKSSELEVFIEDIIKEYNDTFGNDTVSLESLEVEDGVASAVIYYDSINHYKNLTGESAEKWDFNEVKTNLPAQILDINGKEVSMESVAGSKEISKYKVLMIQEEYDVKVSGTIQYYSNCTLLNNTTVHTAGDGVSIIIYK